jgi:molecular chaperone GrpE
MSDSGDRQEGTAKEASGADGGGDDGAGPGEGDAGQDTPEATGTDGLPALIDAVSDDDATALAVENGLVDPSAVTPGDALGDAVDGASSEQVTHTLAVLGETLARVDAERGDQRERIEDLESRLRRKQADFQNYKKRQKERMEEERERATEDLVERLLDVRDNLARALDTDENADIRDGIESTLAQFDRELDRENVDRIEPDSGDTVDPVRHEVLATVPSGEPADAIADIHRPGYEMAGKVLRPAQVTVSDGASNDDSGADGDEREETEPNAEQSEAGDGQTAADEE